MLFKLIVLRKVFNLKGGLDLKNKLFSVFTIGCIIIVMFSLVACSQSNEEVSEAEMIELTLEELSEFDGQDGRAAYIAVDGVIYDVSESKRWKDGKHNGYTAGKDLTEEIKNISPHGVSKLKQVPAIGKLKD